MIDSTMICKANIIVLRPERDSNDSSSALIIARNRIPICRDGSSELSKPEDRLLTPVKLLILIDKN